MNIECRNLTCGYGKTPLDNPIIKNISLDINESESVAILGANGCGKTTLIRALSGILPYDGSIKIDGTEVRKLKRNEIAKKISVLMQFSDIYFSYTVEETVMLGRYLYTDNFFGIPSTKDKEIVDECLLQYGLEDIRNSQINQLSGGQLQRVLLARTMAQKTPFIILDEPTNHLDIKYQAELIDFLSDWKKESSINTLVGVFHDISIAFSVADRIIVMKDGHILGNGTKDEILSNDFLTSAYDIDVRKYMEQMYSNWS